jgi:hypothetical protein
VVRIIFSSLYSAGGDGFCTIFRVGLPHGDGIKRTGIGGACCLVKCPIVTAWLRVFRACRLTLQKDENSISYLWGGSFSHKLKEMFRTDAIMESSIPSCIQSKNKKTNENQA